MGTEQRDAKLVDQTEVQFFIHFIFYPEENLHSWMHVDMVFSD